MSTPTEIAQLVTATNSLTQTVIDTRSEIVNTVATKIAELDAWKAAFDPAAISAEPRYHSVIDLTDLPTDRYYPVWWEGPHNTSGVSKITIMRAYFDDREIDPFGDNNGHVAGLLLQLEATGSAWSGGAKFLHIKRLSQTYRKTVRLIRFAMRCASVGPVPGYPQGSWANTTHSPIRSGLYLRGGLHYQVMSNHYPELNYSRLDTEVEICSEVKASENNTSGRWMVKSYGINDSFLGGDYNDHITPYSVHPAGV